MSNPVLHKPIRGLVLCGGHSTRMQQDKALIHYHGKPQYEYVYDLLQPYCEQVFISGRKEVDYGTCPVIHDIENPEPIGPLAGILAAYEKINSPWLVVAIDYPNFGNEALRHLIDSYDDTYDATVYFDPDKQFFEPFLGIYQPAMLQFIKENGSRFNFSAQKILLQGMVKKVYPLQDASILNINTADAFTRYMQQNHD